MLPDSKGEIDPVFGGCVRDVAQHFEILIPLIITQSGDTDLRKLGQGYPERIRWREVICLVSEYEIKAIEAVACEDGKVILPVFLRVIPALLQILVMEE